MKNHERWLIFCVIAASVLTGCAEEEDHQQYRENESPVIWGQRNVRQIRGQLFEAAEVTADDTNEPVLVSDVSAATTYDMVSAALRGRGAGAIEFQAVFWRQDLGRCVAASGGGSGVLTSANRMTTDHHVIFPSNAGQAENVAGTFVTPFPMCNSAAIIDHGIEVVIEAQTDPSTNSVNQDFHYLTVSEAFRSDRVGAPSTNDPWDSAWEGIADRYRMPDYPGAPLGFVESNPLLANRLFVLGLDSWAKKGASTVRNNLHHWYFEPVNPAAQVQNLELGSTTQAFPDYVALRSCDTEKDILSLERVINFSVDTNNNGGTRYGDIFPPSSPLIISTGDFRKSPGVFFNYSDTRPFADSALIRRWEDVEGDGWDQHAPVFAWHANGWPNSSRHHLVPLISGPDGIRLNHMAPDSTDSNVCAGWSLSLIASGTPPLTSTVDSWGTPNAPPRVTHIFNNLVEANYDAYAGSSGGGVGSRMFSFNPSFPGRMAMHGLVQGIDVNGAVSDTVWANGGPQNVNEFGLPDIVNGFASYYDMPFEGRGSLTTIFDSTMANFSSTSDEAYELFQEGENGFPPIDGENGEAPIGNEPFGPGPCRGMGEDEICDRFTGDLEDNTLFGTPLGTPPSTVIIKFFQSPESISDTYVDPELSPRDAADLDFTVDGEIHHFGCDTRHFGGGVAGALEKGRASGMGIGFFGSAALYRADERGQPVLIPHTHDATMDPELANAPIPINPIREEDADRETYADLQLGIGVGSLQMACAPWGLRTYTSMWDSLIVIGRALTDDVIHTMESPLAMIYERLPWVLVDQYERRWLRSEDRFDFDAVNGDTKHSMGQSVMRPVSGKMCPPNFYMTGVTFFHTPKCEGQGCPHGSRIYITGMRSLLCRTNVTPTENEADRDVPQMETTEVFFSPQMQDFNVEQDPWQGPWEDYTLGSVNAGNSMLRFGLEQGVGHPGGQMWLHGEDLNALQGGEGFELSDPNAPFVGRIECNNLRRVDPSDSGSQIIPVFELVSGFGVKSDGSGAIRGLWLSCSDARPTSQSPL